MDEENFNVSNQDVVENEEDERARTIPVYQKELTLEDREEAERIKAMPEYQELEQSCESYMYLSDTVQSGEIKKMPELLKKLPENLRSLYFEQLHDFEQTCEIEVKLQKITSMSILGVVIYLAVLSVFSHYWDSLNWSWWGKGISFIVIMYILPKFFAKLLNLCRGTKLPSDINIYLQKDLLNYCGALVGTSIPLCIMYLCGAFAIFMLPSWRDFSWLGWKTPIAWAVVIALICVIVWFGKFDLLHKMGNRAAVYVKNFEDFTSQYDEYRNFKKSAEGAKE